MCVAFDNNNTELQIYLENGCTNTHKERRQSGTQFTLNIAILLYGEGRGGGGSSYLPAVRYGKNIAMCRMKVEVRKGQWVLGSYLTNSSCHVWSEHRHAGAGNGAGDSSD